MTIVKRTNTYQLRRRVPKRYKTVESRETIWISLHTDSQSIAKRKAVDAWEELLQSWEAKLAGSSDHAQERYDAARELANIRGFRYMDVSAISKLPLENLLDRIASIRTKQGEPDPIEAKALLGTVEKPNFSITQALELYWDLAKEKTIGKNTDQCRRWRNPRIKAIKNLVNVIGDKNLSEITRDDMLDFRQFWLERIQTGEVTANSANKDLIHIGDVLKTINSMKRLNLELPLGELSFKQGEKNTRPPFSVSWIKNKILANGALSHLNDEARGLLIGMINTGYRPSEGATLTRQTIFLDTAIPHISIEPNGRQLKTPHSRRKIPLTGVSLEVFREFPDGFPRYKKQSAPSATINKFLKDNGLLESPQHSMYSLRHSFEDRMLSAGIDERIRRDIFGHTLNRERYGRGASLDHVALLLEKIAI